MNRSPVCGSRRRISPLSILYTLCVCVGLFACTDPHQQLVADAPLLATHMVDAEGDTFRFYDMPKRVLPLSAHQVGWLMYYGYADRMVAVPEYAELEQPPLNLPLLATMPDSLLDWADVRALAPDLILASADVYIPKGLKARAAEHGLRVFVQSVRSVADILRENIRLGQLMGFEARAQDEADRLQQFLGAMQERLQGQSRPRAVLIINQNPLVVLAGGHFLSDMVRLTHTEVFAADKPSAFLQVDADMIADFAPDIVYMLTEDLNYYDGLMDLYPKLRAVPAVVQERLRALAPGTYLQPGPNLPLLILTLAKVAHPQVHLANLFNKLYETRLMDELPGA